MMNHGRPFFLAALTGLSLVSALRAAKADIYGPLTSPTIGPFNTNFGSGTGANPVTNVTLPKFDTTLGTLTGISLAIGSTITTRFSGHDRSGNPNNVTLTSQGTISLYAPIGSPSSASLIVYTIPSNTPPSFPVAANANFGPTTVVASGSSSVVSYNGSFLPFKAAGGDFLTLPVTANGQSNASDDNGNITSIVSTKASVYVSVTYTYTPATPPLPVTGRIALEGVGDLSTISAAAPLGTFHLSFRAPGSLTQRFGYDVTLATSAGSPNGTYAILVPAGTYDVWIKGSKNLAVLQPNVVVSAASGTMPDSLLGAGDSDNSNAVNVLDFGSLVSAYGTIAASNGYDPKADYNFDGAVDIFDFGLLVNNYGAVGAK